MTALRGPRRRTGPGRPCRPRRRRTYRRASIYADNNRKARIHLVDLPGATDVLGRDSLTDPSARPGRPVRKTLMTDLSDVPGLPRVDNVEGITLGPRLPDGRRTVVLVSDDNFAARQVTQFIAFATHGI
ncbi:esterase-like activity of phytase family protein [Streptomyces sp. NPDC005483]|uniref:esterase-like activity of phytase family protein n=1 Tax=Streptomyces sp. NPDC005483 TaxID=3154882 RepID=UPI0033A7B770